MNEATDVQELVEFESDFNWSDVEVVDDTEAMFFGAMKAV